MPIDYSNPQTAVVVDEGPQMPGVVVAVDGVAVSAMPKRFRANGVKQIAVLG